ncbi:MAG: LysE family transporter [Acuticoccus sp.]
MHETIPLLWLAALPLMGTPGPATLSLAGMGTAYGFRRGLPYLLGIMAGTTGVLVMIATGVTALLLAVPALVEVLAFLAAGYILYLAWRIATAPVLTGRNDTRRAPQFLPGFLLAIANPKAFAAIGAVYSGHVVMAGAPLGDALAKVATLASVILVVNPSWLALGALFSRVLSDPRLGRIANIVFALLLVATLALMVLRH